MTRTLLLWGGIGIAFLFAAGWWWYDATHVPEPIRSDCVWETMAQYPLTDTSGQPVAPLSFKGRVVLLDFIYTRCPSVCPRLQSRLHAVLSHLPPSDKLVAVSISLDPERDTPLYLATYAESYRVPGQRWLFLRPASQKWAIQLATEVFGLTAAPLEGEEILHSDAILLIDCAGRIRGVYSSEDDRLLTHASKLLQLCAR